MYVKAVPETTYDQLERAFRSGNFNVWIIGYVKISEQVYMIDWADLDCSLLRRESSTKATPMSISKARLIASITPYSSGNFRLVAGL